MQRILPGVPALVVILFLLGAVRPVEDGDLYLHLATGRLIAETGQVPSTDPFSVTARGQEWVAHEWLFAVVAGALHARGGEALLLVLKLLAFGLYLFLIDLTVRLSGIEGRLARGAALFLAALSTINVWQERPHLVTILMLAATRLALMRYENSDDSRMLLSLAPLHALWGNMHGGFVLTGLPWTASVLTRLARGESRRAGILVALGLGSAAFLCLNPWGPEHLLYPFRYAGGAAFKQYVQEWSPPEFPRDVTLFTCLALGLAAALRRWRDVDPGQWFPLAAAAVLALSANRNFFLVGLFSAPLLASWVDACVTGSVRLKRLEARDARMGLWAPVMAVLGVLTLILPRMDWKPRRLTGVEAAVRACPDLAGQPLFNDYDLAGHLLWTLGTRADLFVDSRIDLYDKAGVLEHFLQIHERKEGWSARLEQYGIRWAVYRPDERIVAALKEKGWTVRYEEDQVVALAKPDSPGKGAERPGQLTPGAPEPSPH